MITDAFKSLQLNDNIVIKNVKHDKNPQTRNKQKRIQKYI